MPTLPPSNKSALGKLWAAGPPPKLRPNSIWRPTTRPAEGVVVCRVRLVSIMLYSGRTDYKLDTDAINSMKFGLLDAALPINHCARDGGLRARCKLLGLRTQQGSLTLFCESGRHAMCCGYDTHIHIYKTNIHTPWPMHTQPSLMRFWGGAFVEFWRRPPRRSSPSRIASVSMILRATVNHCDPGAAVLVPSPVVLLFAASSLVR